MSQPEPHAYAVPRSAPGRVDQLRYSVCTLVNDWDDYTAMLASAEAAGFDDSRAEFLYGDNREGNAFDGFSGLARLMAEARGTYIILVHQDVRFEFDNLAALDAQLAELEHRDPNWAVAGNAGRRGENYHLHISDPMGEDRRLGQLPAPVDVLDENFIVIRRASFVAPSRDLAGFHLYGLDLVRNAAMRGFGAWAIDFHIRHLSLGRLGQAYLEALEAYEAAKGRFGGGIVNTMIEPVFLSPSPWRHLTWLFKKRQRKKNVFYAVSQNGAAPNVPNTL